MGKHLNPSEIPGATPIEDFSDLKLKHLKNRGEVSLAEYQSINRMLAKYFLAPLTDRKVKWNYEWLLKLHREMFDEVWDYAGKIRKTELSVGVKAHLIGSELHRLISDFHQWTKDKRDPLEMAVLFHHRLVWIHPFKGGNGRWARFVSNIYLRKNKQPMVLWPEQQMIAEGGLREQYIRALQQADHGHFKTLTELHRKYQGKA